jgi:hypothetical protein
MTFCSLFNFNARLPCEIRKSVINETELVIRLLIFDNKDSALLTLLDDSDATLGPGLISIVVFVKDEINCVTRLDLQVGSVECIWLEIKINNKKYLYGTFYIPPNSGH